MNVRHLPESKSAEGYYGRSYQENMVAKYKDRQNNHRKSRIDLAHRLVDTFILPNLLDKPITEIILLDVGCSIGTFAIEFAKKGFRTFGIDFSPSAIDLAKELSREEEVATKFIHGDIVDFTAEFSYPVDIVSCFDIFEHLHDDELGSLLKSLKEVMAEKSYLIFHTYPTQYDYIFFGKPFIRLPMILCKYLPPKYFDVLVKAYAAFIDILKLIIKGKTHKELIKDEAHCNPLTQERLEALFERAGWELIFIETSHLYMYNEWVQKVFSKQRIVDRDIQGIAMPIKK